MRINPILIGILAVGCANKDDEERELSPFLDADQDDRDGTTTMARGICRQQVASAAAVVA